MFEFLYQKIDLSNKNSKSYVEPLSKNKIKLIRSLRLKKNRDSEGLFMVEGEKMVSEIIRENPASIEFICTSESNAIFNRAYHTDERSMKEISNLSTPPSLIAIVRKTEINESAGSFILALDGIQDPGNMGTIIRTADWFGVDRIICSKETVDCYNSKVIQASMGSIFRVPVDYVDLNAYLKDTELPVFGALLDGEDLYKTTIQQSAIILIGNEGNGISDQLRAHVDRPILIPNYGKGESLNASIATGILLAEFRRQ
ncbi:MAG: TrmH family RNA methyltransferase [Flavobacteriaceae bacterium]|jgi:TrmH family RNA methyltransferase